MLAVNRQAELNDAIPWRARSLRRANPLPQVLHGYAFGGAEACCGIWECGGIGCRDCIKFAGTPVRPRGAGAMLALGKAGASCAPMAVGEGYEVLTGPEYLECSEP